MVKKTKKVTKKLKEPKTKTKKQKLVKKQEKKQVLKVEHKPVHEHKTKVYGVIGFALSLLTLILFVLSALPVYITSIILQTIAYYTILPFIIALFLSLILCTIQAIIKPNIYSRLGTLFSSILAILFILLIFTL